MPAGPLTIPARAARRFILGRQGLWPGRRWTGPAGTEQAMCAVEHLQLDPLNITARSQDLILRARVSDYTLESWQKPTYAERKFFGFDYVWEVYKPLEKRRWGYYVLPILWDDALVARADLKLNRPTNTLQVLRFWLEGPATVENIDFAVALGLGLAELQRFLGAQNLDVKAMRPVALRREARKVVAGINLDCS